jgi:mono/diheme cytochrome c family protein
MYRITSYTSASRFIRASAFAFSLAVLQAQAHAADPLADRDRGRAVARTWCVHCHAVERGETQQRADGLPSFTFLANDRRYTPERLRAFLTRPHGRMPDLNLSREDRDDLIAYILSLSERRGPPPTDPASPRP